MTTSATHPNLKMAEGGGIDPHTVARTERFPGGSGTQPGISITQPLFAWAPLFPTD